MEKEGVTMSPATASSPVETDEGISILEFPRVVTLPGARVVAEEWRQECRRINGWRTENATPVASGATLFPQHLKTADLAADSPCGIHGSVFVLDEEVRVVFAETHPEPVFPDYRRRQLAAIDLLNAWLADDSGYDERTWPELKKAIEENRTSYRRRFGD
jgi:hypothetical protein